MCAFPHPSYTNHHLAPFQVQPANILPHPRYTNQHLAYTLYYNFSMLGARIGAIHSVVFGGFAAPELGARIDHAQPKLIISSSCGIEGGRIISYKPLLDAALALATHKGVQCIVQQRSIGPIATLHSGRDYAWDHTLPHQVHPDSFLNY